MIYLCHQMWLDILVRDPQRRRFRDPGPGIQPYFMILLAEMPIFLIKRGKPHRCLRILKS